MKRKSSYGRMRTAEEWSLYWKDNVFTANPLTAPEIKERFNIIKGILRQFKPTTVLETGCGSGVISIPYVINGCRVILLDVSLSALKIARALYRSLGLDVEVLLGDAFNLPFRNGEFDLVHNQGVFEHFSSEDCVKMLREMRRTTTSLVVVFVPYEFNFIYRLAKLYCKIFKREWSLGGEIERNYSDQALIREFRRAGLRTTFCRRLRHTGGLKTFIHVILPLSLRKQLTRHYLTRQPQSVEDFLKRIRKLSSSIFGLFTNLKIVGDSEIVVGAVFDHRSLV